MKYITVAFFLIQSLFLFSQTANVSVGQNTKALDPNLTIRVTGFEPPWSFLVKGLSGKAEINWLADSTVFFRLIDKKCSIGFTCETADVYVFESDNVMAILTLVNEGEEKCRCNYNELEVPEEIKAYLFIQHDGKRANFLGCAKME